MNLNKNEEYWNNRAEQRIIDAENLTTKELKQLQKTYQQAYKEIEKEINAFYGKYSTETGLDITEVRKRLNPQELKEFKEQLRLYYDEVKRLGGYSKDTKAYLRELSAKAYISRLDSLQAQLRWYIENLYREQNIQIGNTLDDGYKESYMKANFDNQKGIGFAYSFNALDDKKVRVAISQNWQGSNFSDRIWADKNKLLETINQKIPQGIALGQNPRTVARDMKKTLETKYSNAERLARTEMNHICNEATKQSYKEVPEVLQQYKIVATLDNRTSEICQEQDGQIYKMSEWQEGVTAPPFHPNCRTTTVPYFDDVDYEEMTRIATDYETGKPYYIPSNMSYKEWRASLTEKQEKYFIADKKSREQHNQDKQQLAEYRKLQNKNPELFEGMPRTLKEYQQYKYLEPEKYEILKENARIARSI